MAYVNTAFEVIGLLGSIATALSHLPLLGPRTQAFLSRFGLTTTKFLVAVKPKAEQ